MPHQIIEYSANLSDRLAIDELIGVMHQSAASIDAFPLAGLRTRAVCRIHYRIADNHPDNGFVHVLLRIAHGRSLDVQREAGDHLFQSLCGYLAPIYDQGPLAISFEMQEINPLARWKQNNLREYLQRRATR